MTTPAPTAEAAAVPPAGLPAPATAAPEPAAPPPATAPAAPAPAPVPTLAAPASSTPPAPAPQAPAAAPAPEPPGDGDLASRVERLERTNLLQRVAIAHGVPSDLVGRLQGATEAELTADAQVLMARFAAPVVPPTTTAPSQGPRPQTPESEASALYETYYPTPQIGK